MASPSVAEVMAGVECSDEARQRASEFLRSEYGIEWNFHR